MSTEYLDLFREIFFKKAVLFKKNFLKVQAEFGDVWNDEFNIHLEKLFARDEEKYLNAVLGYSSFAIDAMRLQKKFNGKLKYENVTYEEACNKVYMNEDYMLKLYLPGIYVSHFLWRHHFKQFIYYKEKFLPLLDKGADKRFYDVGTGTGFYTIQIFRYRKDSQGYGVDISPYSRLFTQNNVNAWGFDNRFNSVNINIIDAALEALPFIQCVEVLEHLSNPQLFLNNLRKLLKTGGYGFITAALTAPNADHIYLYWTPEDVIKQLKTAGFTIIDFVEELAYEGMSGEHVPKLGAFIVS